MGTKKFRPVVNDSSDEGFHDTEFAIDAQYLSEKMENHVVFAVFSDATNWLVDKWLIYDPLLTELIDDCLKTRETRILRCPAIRPNFISSWKIIRPKRDTKRMIFIFAEELIVQEKHVATKIVCEYI